MILSNLARFLIYVSLSILLATTVYGTFFVSAVYHYSVTNTENIRELQLKMAERELVAKTYVPMLLAVKSLVDSHQDILQRIMDRQVLINKLLEKPLERK